ncbi:MAG TPA: hypothetical protein DHV36_17180 [Desulfobacteraceae bacterium]|nr:hypothetical protein [Desulfobacteraceae bacterium]
MNLTAILFDIRLPDIVDILLITIVVYQFYAWFWGTQAFKVLVGLAILSLVFLVAKSWGLILTTWVFQILWPVFVIMLIILFQKEIRQMLERFNPMKMMGNRHGRSGNGWIEGFSGWIFQAAKKRTGVLVVFQRRSLVDDHITRGLDLKSDPQPEILSAVFDKDSPLHDGAMLVVNGKVVSVSCFLPLSTRDDLPRNWGTRHRAALGLTEKCDAGVLVVSEERGTVTLIDGGDVMEMKTPEDLAHALKDMTRDPRTEHVDIKTLVLGWTTRRFRPKLLVFSLVFVVWLAFAGQQDLEKTLDVPLGVRNLSAGLKVAAPEDPRLTITCRGLRKDISILNPKNVSASVDLSEAGPGQGIFTVSTADLSLPNKRIQVARITPSTVVMILEEK